MGKAPKMRRFADQWSDRAMVAYRCGARLAVQCPDVVITYQNLDIDLGDLLTQEESEARKFLAPASWEARWWQGWHDASAATGDTDG